MPHCAPLPPMAGEATGRLPPGRLSPGRLRWALLSAALGACVPEGPPTWHDAMTSGPLRVAPLAADAAVPGAWRDTFERGALGSDYHALSTAWRIRDGALCAAGGAKNQGVWLRRPLPINARIEVEARSDSPDGDIKLEVWGDGRSGATGTSYDDATSYVLIFGGWQNQRHAMARMNEHGDDRMVIEVDAASDDPRARAVTPGQTYRFRIERRDGRTVSWWIDDVLYFQLPDPEPLAGPGHDHLGFNNWTTPVCFDNLEITPL